MSVEIKSPKKLIEVALPLDLINAASAYEKNPGIGAHPRGLHLWWARRPLAAARAILFAQMVNDPGYERQIGRGVNKEAAHKERQRLFDIIARLVDWKNLNNEAVLREAHQEILKSWQETCLLNEKYDGVQEFDPKIIPSICDPFAGGGAIPLEAHRLGLGVFAGDLNPVAVTINKAMVEFPRRFISCSPICKQSGQRELDTKSTGLRGLAVDIAHYGERIRKLAEDKIGHIYPPLLVTKKLAEEYPELISSIGQKIVPLTYIWTRTITCPNPACSITMPMLSTYFLSSKRGREKYIHVNVKKNVCEFDVSSSKPTGISDAASGLKRGTSGIFECVSCGNVTTRDYTASIAISRGLGIVPVAVVCSLKRGKAFLPAKLFEFPEVEISAQESEGFLSALAPNPRDVWCRNFGLLNPLSLFTKRQFKSLITLADSLKSIETEIESDALAAGLSNDGVLLSLGGTGAKAYSELISIYLAFAIDRTADFNSQVCTWKPSGEQVMQTFKRQALPMTWDFPESNIFADRSICWTNSVKYTAEGISTICQYVIDLAPSLAARQDARFCDFRNKVVSTDPPYYDNIGYADISDFFYVWLKRSVAHILPDLFENDLVPKADEMVAIGYRHSSAVQAATFFMTRMKDTLSKISKESHPAFPVAIYYAFKQSDTASDGTFSTGWEAFLDAVIQSGLSITGTWPLRTEQSGRIISAGTNALASSIVLVCRKRLASALSVSRREFIRELNSVLPNALDEMTTGGVHSPVAPVDLSQAIIGPGMAIFSQYSAVLEADGRPMSVRSALQLINRFLAQDDFDKDTQFCLNWFDQYCWAEGPYGEAEVLTRAKGTSVDGLEDAGIVESVSGSVRLIKSSELSENWLPENDKRVSIWEILHQMIRRFTLDGEVGAGEILSRASQFSEKIRTLAYRLYTLCERKAWSQDAGHYDQLVKAWDGIETAARSVGYTGTQISLFGEEQTNPSEPPKSKKKTRKKNQ